MRIYLNVRHGCSYTLNPGNGFLRNERFSTMMKDSLLCSVQTALAIIFCQYVFNVCASKLPENFGILSSNVSPRNTLINASHFEPNVTVWQDLAIATVEFFKFQNDLQPLQGRGSILLLVLYENSTQAAATEFVSCVSTMHTEVILIHFPIQKGDVNFEHELKNIIGILIDNRGTINSIVMFLDNTTFVFELLDNVCFMKELYFTAVRHVTEWIIVSRHFPISLINDNNYTIDFISIIFKADINIISIAQKSRNENFRVKVKMQIDPVQLMASKDESRKRLQRCLRRLAARNIVRKSGELYLKSQKSVLSGLHLPVAMVSIKTQDLLLRLPKDNLSNYERFAKTLLDFLAKRLDFTYDIVVPKDGGYFGTVNGSNATGMTGKLNRTCITQFLNLAFPYFNINKADTKKYTARIFCLVYFPVSSQLHTT